MYDFCAAQKLSLLQRRVTVYYVDFVYKSTVSKLFSFIFLLYRYMCILRDLMFTAVSEFIQ